MMSHESYVGYNALVSYLRNYNNKSYRGFLDLNRDVIISSLTVIRSWKEIDNTWATRFSEEARRILDETTFTVLKGKVDSERRGNGLQSYWVSLIKEFTRLSAQVKLEDFAYKILFYVNPELIPEEFNPQDSYLCRICQEEILPQLQKPITILTCGHMFHLNCIAYDRLTSCCMFCKDQEEQDNPTEYHQHDNNHFSDHDNSYDDYNHQEYNDNYDNNKDNVDHHENDHSHNRDDNVRPRHLHRRGYVRDNSYYPRVSKTIKKTYNCDDHYDNDYNDYDSNHGQHYNDHHDHEQEDYNDHGHEQGNEELIGPAEQEETNSRKYLLRCSSSPPSSHKQEILQGLIQELFMPINGEVVEINDNNDEEEFEGSIPLVQLFRKACRAETQTINFNQEEISRWYHYGKGYMERVEATMNFHGYNESMARKVVYDDIMKHLPGFNRNTIRNKTQGALRIYNLFKKIGMNRIKWIRSYSASFISNLTTTQIQTIVDYYDHA